MACVARMLALMDALTITGLAMYSQSTNVANPRASLPSPLFPRDRNRPFLGASPRLEITQTSGKPIELLCVALKRRNGTEHMIRCLSRVVLLFKRPRISIRLLVYLEPEISSGVCSLSATFSYWGWLIGS